MKNRQIKNLTITAMLFAIGLVLPFFTAQLPQLGNMLLPMHIPVFLCALICGWKYGFTMAFLLPLIRSLLFGMPPMYPTAVAMAFELGTYALVLGALYAHSKWQCIRALYRCMLTAMLAGRVVWGVVLAVLLSSSGSALTLSMFISSAFLNAAAGIVLQLVLIPAIMTALDRTRLVPFQRRMLKPSQS